MNQRPPEVGDTAGELWLGVLHRLDQSARLLLAELLEVDGVVVSPSDALYFAAVALLAAGFVDGQATTTGAILLTLPHWRRCQAEELLHWQDSYIGGPRHG